MNEDGRRVIGGVDAHADTHHAAALDDRGALSATEVFAASGAGYQELLAWLRGFGESNPREEALGCSISGSTGRIDGRRGVR